MFLQADDLDEAAETVLANALFVPTPLSVILGDRKNQASSWRQVMSYLLAALPAAAAGAVAVFPLACSVGSTRRRPKPEEGLARMPRSAAF